MDSVRPFRRPAEETEKSKRSNGTICLYVDVQRRETRRLPNRVLFVCLMSPECVISRRRHAYETRKRCRPLVATNILHRIQIRFGRGFSRHLARNIENRKRRTIRPSRRIASFSRYSRENGAEQASPETRTFEASRRKLAFVPHIPMVPSDLSKPIRTFSSESRFHNHKKLQSQSFEFVGLDRFSYGRKLVENWKRQNLLLIVRRKIYTRPIVFHSVFFEGRLSYSKVGVFLIAYTWRTINLILLLRAYRIDRVRAGDIFGFVKNKNRSYLSQLFTYDILIINFKSNSKLHTCYRSIFMDYREKFSFISNCFLFRRSAVLC